MNETNFSWALSELKSGHYMHRLGWNGKGQYIAAQLPDDNSKMTAPYLYLCNTAGQLVPWVPSQGDLFAIDWDWIRVSGTFSGPTA